MIELAQDLTIKEKLMDGLTKIRAHNVLRMLLEPR